MPEAVEEKQGQQPPAARAAAPRVPRHVFARLGRLWLVLGVLCWAAALAFLLSRWDLLGKRSVAWGRLELSPLGIGIGAVAAVAGIWAFLKYFGGRLDWYKAGQASVVRATGFTCVAALTFYGSYAFYQIPSTASAWWEILWKLEVFGKVLALRPILFPSAGVFLGVMMAAYLLLNQPKWAEFQIETEGEIKKVSWPPRKEYVGSAVVVVVVVAVISFFLWGVDTVLSEVMRWWGMGF
jgi:preprotein translocase subunit SecE